MTGKEKCKYLKELRATIAASHNIEGFEYKECDFEGVCSGTCPMCDAEAEALYEILREKGKLDELKALEDILKFSYIPEKIKEECQEETLMGDIEPPKFDFELSGKVIPTIYEKPLRIKDLHSNGNLMGLIQKPEPLPENKKPKMLNSDEKLMGAIIPNSSHQKVDNPEKKPRGLLDWFKKK